MNPAAAVKWGEVLRFDTPVLEIVVRGTLTYLALFFMLRFVLKRETAGVGITDLLVIVMIADAAQNAMAGEYKSVPDGILLVAVIIFWAFTLDWLAYRSAALRRVLRPPRLPLVRDGKMMRHNMARELVTVDELKGELHQQGIEDIGQVKAVYIEPDGRFSVIKADQEQHQEPERRAT